MSMETYRKGYRKTHKGTCKGTVIFVENTDDNVHHEWDLQCLTCGKLLFEDNVEFIKVK